MNLQWGLLFLAFKALLISAIEAANILVAISMILRTRVAIDINSDPRTYWALAKLILKLSIFGISMADKQFSYPLVLTISPPGDLKLL